MPLKQHHDAPMNATYINNPPQTVPRCRHPGSFHTQSPSPDTGTTTRTRNMLTTTTTKGTRATTTRTTRLLTLFFLSRDLFRCHHSSLFPPKECSPSSQYQPLAISMPNSIGTINEDENHTLHLNTLELVIPCQRRNNGAQGSIMSLDDAWRELGNLKQGIGTCIWPFWAHLQLPLHPNTPITSQGLPKPMEHHLHPRISWPTFAIATNGEGGFSGDVPSTPPKAIMMPKDAEWRPTTIANTEWQMPVLRNKHQHQTTN